MLITPHTIQNRWRALRRQLDATGIDTLLVSDQFNFCYLTGRLSREFDKRYRHLLFLLDNRGDAHALVPSNEVAAMQEIIPQLALHVYESEPLDPGVAAAFIRGGLYGARRLGLELGGFDRPCLTGTTAERTIGLLFGVEALDASPLLARARLIKSPEEIAALAAAGQLTQKAWEAVAAGLGTGISLREIAGRLASAFAEAGGDYNFPGHLDLRNATNPASPVIEAGEVLWCDLGITVEGYHADIARRLVMGRPTRSQSENHRRGVELMASLSQSLMPGRPIHECMHDMLVLRAKINALPERGSRFGHGVGLCAAEAPSLSASEPAVLQPGMVLTPEPSFTASDGEFVHVEEMVAIGCDEAIPLTAGGHRLYEVG